MPEGAWTRTSTEQTAVPTITKSSEPLVTTWTGSCPGTSRTVYCHVPAHNGPVIASLGSIVVFRLTRLIT